MGLIRYHAAFNNQIILRCTDDAQGLMELYDVLTDMKMCVISMQGHVLAYDFDSIIGSKNFQTIGKQTLINKFISLSEAPGSAIDKFMSENEFEEFYMRGDRLNRKTSRVYMEGSVVAGILYVCSDGRESYSVPAVYLNSALKFDEIVPLLYAAGIKAASEENERGHRIVVCLSKDSDYNDFVKIFGEPECEALVHDYSLQCEDANAMREAMELLDEYNSYYEESLGDATLDEFFKSEECSWVSPAVVTRATYAADLRKMPDRQLKELKSEVFEWYDKWEIFYKDEYWKKLLFECGREKAFESSMKVSTFYTGQCMELLDEFNKTGKIPESKMPDCSPEDIRTFVFEEESPFALDILPEHLKKRVMERDYLIVGAMTPSNEVVGISLVSRMTEECLIAYHEYMHVLENYQNMGVEKKLMDTVLYVIQQSGCTALYTKDLYTRNGMINVGELIGDKISLAKKCDSIVLTYSLKKILESKFVKEVMPNRELSDEITYIFDREDPIVSEAAKMCWQDGYYISKDDYDPLYTAFIVEKGKPVGVALAAQVSSHELMIRDYYISKSCKLKDPIIELLSAVIVRAKDNIDENSIIVFRLADRRNAEVLAELLGPGEKTIKSTELFYRIDEGDALSANEDELWMPAKISIREGVIEKIRLSKEICSAGSSMDLQSSMMLDVSSRVPGNVICNYMREFYFGSDSIEKF